MGPLVSGCAVSPRKKSALSQAAMKKERETGVSGFYDREAVGPLDKTYIGTISTEGYQVEGGQS